MIIAIVGFGLIGSSIARRQLERDPGSEIILVDADKHVRATAKKLGLATQYTASISDIPRHADFIILATPVQTIARLIGSCIDISGPETVITDVGSVKGGIVDAALAAYPEFNRFVPAHPMAGSEHSGPQHGRADLLTGRPLILTPYHVTAPSAVDRVSHFFENLGAHIYTLDVAAHDEILATVSHLPHALSFAYLHQALALKQKCPDYARYSAGSFRDMTRIAQSDPDMWTDIFAMNNGPILEGLRETIHHLEKIYALIEQNDRENLHQFLRDAREERQNIGVHYEP